MHYFKVTKVRKEDCFMAESYQMGWTLSDSTQEDYYFAKNNNRYFIKKNMNPMIAILAAEKIVPKLKWTKRLNNGEVIIAQDFEHGKNLSSQEMIDERIPKMLKRVHKCQNLKKIMLSQGYKEQTSACLLKNLKPLISQELLENSDIRIAFNYLENNKPKLETFSPCHADLHKNNWLLSDSGKLFLVDWEQAILGDSAIDISFILYKYIPQDAWSKWLDLYGQKDTLEYRLKLKWYIAFQTLVMIVWYHGKKQYSEMNKWLVFLKKIFFEFI